MRWRLFAAIFEPTPHPRSRSPPDCLEPALDLGEVSLQADTSPVLCQLKYFGFAFTYILTETRDKYTNIAKEVLSHN